MAPMRLRGLVLAVVVLAGGCGSGEGRTDQEQVCRDLAEYARAGQRPEDRAALVEKIGKRVNGADQRLRDAYGGLQRTLGGSESGFQLAADVFAKTCQDLGVNINAG